jgi:GTPase
LGLQVVEMLQHRLLKQVPELAGAPVLPVSALTGSGADRLLPAVMAAYDVWTRRVPTSRLNRWLEKVTQRKLLAAACFMVAHLDACNGTRDL